MGAILIPKCKLTCAYSDLRGTFTSLDLLFSSACKLHIAYNLYSPMQFLPKSFLKEVVKYFPTHLRIKRLKSRVINLKNFGAIFEVRLINWELRE